MGRLTAPLTALTCCLALLGTAGSACADESLFRELLASPEMTPQMCASDDPDARLVAVESAGFDLDDREARNTFYLAYRTQLRKIIDTEFPDAAEIRPILLEVFRTLDEFMSIGDGGLRGTGDEWVRLAAHVEWLLYQEGITDDETKLATQATTEDVVELGRIITRSHFPDEEDEADRREQLLVLQRALRIFSEVEMELDEPAVCFYRRAIIRYLSSRL